MKTKAKRICAIFFLIFYTFMMLSATNVFADVYIPSVLEDTYVYDSAGILSDETQQNVNGTLYKLEQDTSIEFAVITISSLNGLSIEDYSNQVFNKLGIGKRDSDNGILLLIALNSAALTSP